jgi:hypothetical protein
MEQKRDIWQEMLVSDLFEAIFITITKVKISTHVTQFLIYLGPVIFTSLHGVTVWESLVQGSGDY